MSSNSSIMKQIPFTRFIFQENSTEAAKMTAYFGFNEEMMGYLAGTAKRTSKIIALIGGVAE